MITLDPTFDPQTELIRSARGLRLWAPEYGRIMTKGDGIQPLVLNPLQEMVIEVIEWCLVNNRPIRILILKRRQGGSSTGCTSALYWMQCRQPGTGVIMGGKYKQTNNLWKIYQRYAALDSFDWGFARTTGAHESNFENGARTVKETAKDAEAGRSGTFHYAVITEPARWSEDGVANATEVMTGLLACIPFRPGTMVIQESTARGPAGFFHDNWQEAITFDQLKNGATLDEGQYIKIFCPYYLHEDSRDSLDQTQRDRLQRDLTDEERQLILQYNLDLEHIAFRRRTIRTECKRDPVIFGREYPSTVEEAFAASGNSRFNTAGLKILRQEAQAAHPYHGVLEDPGNNGRYVWRQTDKEDAHFVIYEHPIPGRRYLIAVDPMSGEANDQKGDDRDHHRVSTLRTGYWDPELGWRKPAEVAVTTWPCQIGTDILCERTLRLSYHYGKCLIIPEANYDKGLSKMLADNGGNVYERETSDNRGDVKRSKRSGKYGIYTTGGTGHNARETMIERLAQAIREWDTPNDGIHVWDMQTVSELETFTVTASGRSEAMENAHDDCVLALAIGHSHLSAATPYDPETLDFTRHGVDIFDLEEGHFDGTTTTQGRRGMGI